MVSVEAVTGESVTCIHLVKQSTVKSCKVNFPRKIAHVKTTYVTNEKTNSDKVDYDVILKNYYVTNAPIP